MKNNSTTDKKTTPRLCVVIRWSTVRAAFFFYFVSEHGFVRERDLRIPNTTNKQAPYVSIARSRKKPRRLNMDVNAEHVTSTCFFVE